MLLIVLTRIDDYPKEDKRENGYYRAKDQLPKIEQEINKCRGL